LLLLYLFVATLELNFKIGTYDSKAPPSEPPARPAAAAVTTTTTTKSSRPPAHGPALAKPAVAAAAAASSAVASESVPALSDASCCIATPASGNNCKCDRGFISAFFFFSLLAWLLYTNRLYFLCADRQDRMEKIAMVQSMLPDYGAGFISTCLDAYGV
jgi:hypothetical protein